MKLSKMTSGKEHTFSNGWPNHPLIFLFAVAIAASPLYAANPRISKKALKQIQALMQEKRSWSRTQCKISAQLLLTTKRYLGRRVTAGLPQLRSTENVDGNQNVLVDIQSLKDEATNLLEKINILGGSVVSCHPNYNSVRARIPFEQLETLAAEEAVITIRPADRATTNKTNTSQGDVAHEARQARNKLSVDGSGVKIGVLSDGVNSLSERQASGDLPARVTVLSSQEGSGDEGTAILEIVHDLAPEADLLFATAFDGQAQFAQNIRDLQAAGCKVIVDDVIYFSEPVFQDGIIAQAIEAVTSAGAVYFSAAGNFGNLSMGTSGVWEGDYRPIPAPAVVGSFDAHDFGGGVAANRITADSRFGFSLSWSDPQGGSSNDYDLVLLDSTGTTILSSSANAQTGSQDPFEFISSDGADDKENLLVVVNFSGDDRFLHLSALGGRLENVTDGQIFGHAAAESAIAVAAVDWRDAGGGNGVFNGTESIETFSSDGPRRIFYEADGTAITPGNLLSTGGIVRQKPDVAGADGVATATPGFNPFFGTSAAAPHVASIAALVIDNGKSTTVSDIHSAINTTAFDIEVGGVDRDSGHGIVNAVAAVAFSPCSKIEIVAGTQSPCDLMTNTYIQELTVTYTQPPKSGTLAINGQSFDITGSPQNVLLTDLIADGRSVDVSALFSENPGCGLSLTGLFVAPESCSSRELTCPPDLTIQCSDSTDPEINEALGMASAIIGCDPNPVITYTDIMDLSECGGYTGTLTRTWTVANSEECGSGVSTCTQTITLVDTTAPLLVPPANVTIDCLASVDPSNTGAASAIDNCDGTPTVEFSDTASGSCPTVVTRTWSAVDACGNTETSQQIITLSPDLVGYWTLDDGSGMMAMDSSGNINGKLVNSPKWGAGRMGYSLEFDGDNDYVDLGLIESGHPMQLASGGTLVAWVKLREGDRWQRILDKSSSHSGFAGYALVADPVDRSIQIFVDGTSYKSTNEAFELNRWTHVVAVITATDFEIFIDGVKAAGAFQQGIATLPPDVATTMRMGTWNHAKKREFNGFIDDLRIYNRALNPDEIRTIKEEANPESALVARYRFDEGIGCTTQDTSDSIMAKEGSLQPNCSSVSGDGPAWSPGEVATDSSLEFDGDDDYVDLGLVESGDPLQLISGGTLSAWFKPREGDRWQRILDKSTDHNGINGYALVADPEERSIRIFVDGTSYKSTNEVFKLNRWTHVAAVITAGNIEIFVDGIKIDGTFHQGKAKLPPDMATTMRIGTWNHARKREFNGFIDDLRIYNRALNPDDIRTIMEEANPSYALVARYRFDEGIGCTIQDSSDSTMAKEGSLQPNCSSVSSDGPAWSPGEVATDSSLELDGDDDYVDLGLVESGDPLQLISGGTLSAWFKPREGDRWQRILDKSTDHNGTNGYALVADPEERSIWIFVDGTSYKSTNEVFKLNRWTHVAAVITAIDFEIFIDGVKIDGTFQEGMATLPPDMATTMRIGTWNHSTEREFNGFIDDLRIYNRALNPDNIRIIMEEANLSYALIARYRFDEGMGCTTQDSSDSTMAKEGSLQPNCSSVSNDGPTWSPGEVATDSSLELDGDDDYVDLGLVESGDPLQLISGGTLSAWFKPREGDRWQRILDKSTDHNGTNGYALVADPEERSIWIFVDGTSYKSTNEVFKLNRWTHVAAVITTIDFEIFIDGVKIDGTFQQGMATLPPDMATTMRIGTWNHSTEREFNGFIDDLRIYNRALNPDNIRIIMEEANLSYALIARYRFDEGMGCTTQDSSDSTMAKEGSLQPNCSSVSNDGPTWSPGEVATDSSLEFDGDNDYVDLGLIESGDPLQLLSGGTLSAWFKPREGDRWQRILDKSTDHNGINGYALVADPEERSIRIFVDETSYKTTNEVFEFNRWTHVAVVITASNIEIFIDGAKIDGTFQQGKAKLPPDVATTMRIGTWNHARKREFNGFIDDLRIYNRALNPEDIRVIKEEANPTSTLIAHYKFDEGRGCTTQNTSDSTITKEGSLQPNCSSVSGDGPTWSPADVPTGSSLEFDGDNDYLDLGLIESGHPLQLASGGTLTTWFKPREGDRWQRILDKSTDHNGTNGYALVADPEERSIRIFVDGASYKSTNGIFELNRWTHVAAVITANNIEILIDGVKIDGTFEQGKTKLPPDVATTMRIGTWNHSTEREFNGFLDDLRIYSDTLTADNINAILTEAPPGNIAVMHPNLVANLLSTQGEPGGLSSFNILSRTVYEDAEDESVVGWTAYGEGRVFNISDLSGNRIVATKAKLVAAPFRLGLDDHGDWNNSEEFTAYFAILMEEEAALYFRVDTSEGEKYLCYGPGPKTYGVNNGIIHIGLGIDPDGQWYGIYRDLASDVQKAIPEAELRSVKDFYVFGSMKLDNLMLLKAETEVNQ